MAAPARGSEGEAEDPADRVTAHATSPERTVFTESGNHDGWIASDTTVDVER